MPDAELARNDEIQKKTGYHHGNLRNAIIDADAQLIGERRSAQFQLKDVAALVGTSQPAIYKHFDSKQALLVETAIVGYTLQKQFRDYALKVAAPSPLQKLLGIGYAYVHFAQTYPGFFLLMKYFETDEILRSKRYQQQRDETLTLVRSLIVEAIELDLFVDVNLDLAMTLLQSVAFGLAHQYIGEQIEYVARELHNDKDLVARVFTLSMDSLLSEEGRRELQQASYNPFA